MCFQELFELIYNYFYLDNITNYGELLDMPTSFLKSDFSESDIEERRINKINKEYEPFISNIISEDEL